MSKETAVSRWCERVAEAAWLLALSLVPIFFNLYSARHFEPDKAAVLRSLALIAITAVLIRALDRLIVRGSQRPPPAAEVAPEGVLVAPPPPLWRRFVRLPLAVPALLYALVFLFTTATSVVQDTSFWGSYQRLQGTYTNLSYMLLFVAIVAVVRRPAQIERMLTVTLATATAVAGYGVLQHFQLDPLPWRGDVITRVASTMGNSIFVAAYMIMVLPLALYRVITGLSAARVAPATEAQAGHEWLWTLVRGFFLFGGLILLLAMIKFGAAVRTVDFRYWWLLPGAIASATALWWLLTVPFDRGEGRVPAWPGFLTLGYLLVFGAQFAFTAGQGLQVFATDGTAVRAVDWWLWLFAAIAMVTVAYALALFLPRRPMTPSALSLRISAGAAGLCALLLAVAIFFTQSRGPWLGLGAGLFVFFSLVLWQALRQARATGRTQLVAPLRGLLIAWVTLAVAGGAFLLVFNLSNAPVFERLREVPYLGRMGRLLEVDTGTGLVRRLIWTGDEHAGGAIALITSDPLRAVIGWGPESMFVAFNPFYPPSLANIEARGASPDRSHQALLDELVTKGVLGLASYFFLLFSFVALSWRLMMRSDDWRWKVFFSACLSAVVCHFVEGLTGIPIVSTLMLFWVLLGLTVTGGAATGFYSLSLAAPAPVPPTPTAPEATRGAQAGKKRAQARGSAARGQAQRGQAARPAPASGGSGALLAYGLVAAVALGIALLVNVNPIRADMTFQQGQGIAERGVTLEQLAQSLDDYLITVRLNPREDFYYLNLGRTLMTLAESLRAQGVPLGEPLDNANVDELVRLQTSEQVQSFVTRTSPNAMMSYAEAVLLRAHDLNPRNKDHFANLGRLNGFWYAWSQDPERLRAALDWYERVTPIAPQDVTLLNERAGVLAQLGDYTVAQGDATQAAAFYGQARELLLHSLDLDGRYADTQLRLGDLARVADQDLDAATDAYVQAISLSASAVANSIERIASDLATRPDLLVKLRDAYAAQTTAQEQRLANAERNPEGVDLEAARARTALLHTITGLLSVRAGQLPASVDDYSRAAVLQPANADYSRNYAIVLSDTMRHDEAIAETQRLIAELRRTPGTEPAITEAEQLIALLEQTRR